MHRFPNGRRAKIVGRWLILSLIRLCGGEDPAGFLSSLYSRPVHYLMEQDDWLLSSTIHLPS